MANYVFENLNQATASTMGAGDSLSFATPSLNGPNIGVVASGSDLIVTAMGRSLVFSNQVLTNVAQNAGVTTANGTHMWFGGAGNDAMNGSAGDDIAYGMAGYDRIDGGAGHDFLFGGAGSDTIFGSDGCDHIYGYGFNASVGMDLGDSLDGGAGDDYIQGNAGNDTIFGGDGADRVQGGADNDLIYGDSGNDTLNGNLGSDTIDGGIGNDFVRGGQGRDSLIGGDGSDTLSGDRGTDTLSGGAGADVFRFAASDALLLDLTELSPFQVETITDFAIGVDHIDFGFAPTSLVNGGNALSLELAKVQAVLALDLNLGGNDVSAVGVGSDTYLFYNGAGGLLADSVVKLAGVNATNLSIGDLHI
jgi:serralysin